MTQATVATRTEAARKKGQKRLQHSGLPWILPAMILVVGLIYYSVGYTGYLSTLDWNGTSPTVKHVGAANFVQLLHDKVIRQALWHTLIFYVVTFTVQTTLGFTLAALLHSKLKLRTLHKVIIFVPTVLAPATMGPTFRLMFSADDGIINKGLRAIGLDSLAHPWLADPKTALPSIMVVTIWQWTGMTFILFFAAMSQIEPELLEAARLDGAGNLRTLWYVVWPGCRGTTIALAILGLIGALKTFDWPWLITVGGPGRATEFLGTNIYREAIREYHLGYGAAVSLVLLVLAVCGSILMTVVNRRSTK
ncbi:MAG: sugar ABC transporter permease [Bifidobacteriaceae bacterium]|jgi:ABC-type sugar transport system permease subunit|nr:sugar ABC transporter permease [Bifidobacteriaceae bacterium]